MLAFRQIRMHNRRGEKLFDIDSFDIYGNACIVLSGRNGAGKTTLLKMLAGLESPDHAEVDIDGMQLTWKAARTRLRREVVYLHQQPYMFDRSVADNVGYGLNATGIGRDEIKRRVDEALDWAGLTQLAAHNARELSGGEQQRVALTRARVLSPRLLLLDEPLSNMDVSARQQAILLIRRLKDEGVSTVITSHEPQLSSLLGDEHRHLCKTGPCRYTIVKPFLFQRNIEQANGSENTGSADQERKPDMSSSGTRQGMTAVILAGGMARRMEGQDKGLIELDGRPMIEHIIDALKGQVDRIVINANRNLERYEQYGYPVVKDIMGDYFGPLVGMASGIQACDSELILTVPCDSPFVPAALASRLGTALIDQQADIAVARDSKRLQPVFALIKRSTLPGLIAYLEDGGRKIDTWYAEHAMTEVDFSDLPDTFININTPEDKLAVEQKLAENGR